MASRNLNNKVKCCVCMVRPDVDKEMTLGDLAMTPSQIKQLSDKGVACSMPNLDYLDSDGAPKHDYSVSGMFRRGMTREELWQNQQIARKNVINAQRVDKLQYGK